jgi:hypothetical protein
MSRPILDERTVRKIERKLGVTSISPDSAQPLAEKRGSGRMIAEEVDLRQERALFNPALYDKGSSSSGGKCFGGFPTLFQRNCHSKTFNPDDGDAPLFRIGKSLIFPGVISDLQDTLDWDLVIDCSGGRFCDGNATFPAGYEELASTSLPVISLPWADFSPPPMKLEFWIKLAAKLPEGNIGIGCFGGHGRTGTALACLLVVTTNKTADQAIDFVRRNYCKECIECGSQEAYIELLADSLGK